MKQYITVTIDQAVFDKLPVKGRSAYINIVLKQHFQKEGADQLYETIKHRLMRDKDIGLWIETTAREAV